MMTRLNDRKVDILPIILTGARIAAVGPNPQPRAWHTCSYLVSEHPGFTSVETNRFSGNKV